MSSSGKTLLDVQELDRFLSTGTEEPVEHNVKWRIMKTVCIYLGFTCLGMSQSVLGSSFADTEILLSTDTSHLSAAFTANNVGYLAGSVLCALLCDRFHPEPQQALVIILVALSTAVAPFYKNITWFISVMVIQGVGMAYIDSGTQAYCLSVWRGHRLQDAMMQGIFMAWSVGSTICPFILQPFLSPIPKLDEDQDNTSCYDQRDLTNSGDMDQLTSNITHSMFPNSNRSHGVMEMEGYNVAYGYLIIGMTILPSSLLYFAVHIASKNALKIDSGNDKEDQAAFGKEPRKAVLIGQMFVFFMIYVGLEVGFGGLLSLYVVRSFCLSGQKAAFMTSLFWGSTGIGRMLGVPISFFLTPAQMLLGNVSLILVALVFMVTLVETHPAILWCSVVSAGIGMSTIYPSAYLWCSRYIKIKGAATSVFNVGGSIGSMVLPLATGVLVDVLSPNAFVFSMLALALVLLLLYVLIHLFTRCLMVEVKEIEEPCVSADCGTPALIDKPFMVQSIT